MGGSAYPHTVNCNHYHRVAKLVIIVILLRKMIVSNSLSKANFTEQEKWNFNIQLTLASESDCPSYPAMYLDYPTCSHSWPSLPHLVIYRRPC